MDIKILAFDLDGTTLVNHSVLPEDNRIALERAHEKGVQLVPCTGRIKTFLPESISALPGLTYVISSNGASVDNIITGENIYKALIPTELTLKIQKIIDEYDIYEEYYVAGVPITLNGNPEKARANPEFFPHSKHAFLRKEYRFIDNFTECASTEKLEPEKINLPYLPPEIRSEVFERLSTFPELKLTSSIPDNIEINIQAANKGAALEALTEHLELTADNCMSIGDNGNDAAMLEYAGVSVAMANSSDEAFAAAKYRTDSVENCGLARAIERYILGY